jgi:3-isopropylmalate dehydratase small subunit
LRGEAAGGTCFFASRSPPVIVAGGNFGSGSSREEAAEMLASAAAGVAFTVDLEAQTVTVGNCAPMSFDIQPERRLALLNGWDETDLVLPASPTTSPRSRRDNARSSPGSTPRKPLHERE